MYPSVARRLTAVQMSARSWIGTWYESERQARVVELRAIREKPVFNIADAPEPGPARFTVLRATSC